MTSSHDRRWLYLEAASGREKGPLREEILKNLLKKGILQPTQLVWAAHLKEWTPITSTAPFATYWQTWQTLWHFMMDNKQQEPVATKELIQLFLDGKLDGLSLVWSNGMSEWKSISEVPALKEFLHEANEQQDREESLLEAQSQVSAQDQVFVKDSKTEVFVAEDGKSYCFEPETKRFVTPEEKIEDDLEALRDEQLEDDAAQLAGRWKSVATKSKAVHPPLPPQVHNQPAAPPEQLQQPTPIKNSEGTGEQPPPPSTDGVDDPNQKKKKKKKKRKNKDKWRQSKNKTWVYVNGLPLDITETEIHDHFAKCGIIQRDLVTNEPRIKLYRNKQDGGLNGDASICYMKEASVELAIQLLDKSFIRPEWPIDVSRAVFAQKGEEFVQHKRIKLDTRAKVKRIQQEKALSWNEGDDEDRDGLRIVVIKHMFTPDEIQDDVYEQELLEDIQSECLKIGDIVKVTLFSKHVDGVVIIKFASGGSAARCIEIMNGRFFAGRKLECGFWDGTDYTVRESNEEQAKRSENFASWLEGRDGDGDGDGAGSSTDEDEEEDDEEDNEEDDEEEARAHEEQVHAGRILPPLES